MTGPAMAAPEEAGLLAGCRAGDLQAWRRFFRIHSRQIYKWSVLLGLGGAEAEEAAQEVLAIAARRIEHCPSEQAVLPWLFQITRRVVANVRRGAWFRRFWHKGLDEAAAEISPALEQASTADQELELSVRACLRRLPQKQREMLILADLEGRTRDEVAALLDIPAGTVASRLAAAREAFRMQWANLDEVGASGGGR